MVHIAGFLVSTFAHQGPTWLFGIFATFQIYNKTKLKILFLQVILLFLTKQFQMHVSLYVWAAKVSKSISYIKLHFVASVIIVSLACLFFAQNKQKLFFLLLRKPFQQLTVNFINIMLFTLFPVGISSSLVLESSQHPTEFHDFVVTPQTRQLLWFPVIFPPKKKWHEMVTTAIYNYS